MTLLSSVTPALDAQPVEVNIGPQQMKWHELMHHLGHPWNRGACGDDVDSGELGPKGPNFIGIGWTWCQSIFLPLQTELEAPLTTKQIPQKARIIAQLLTALVANEHGLSAGEPNG